MKRYFLCSTTALLLCAHMLFGVEPKAPGAVTGAVAVGSSPDYLEAWRRPPVEGKPPVVPVVKEFAIGETAYLGFIITGLVPDESGRGNVTVDLKLIKPDGTFMFDEKDVSRLTGPVSKEPGFYLSDPAVDITFEPGDPVGCYSLVIVYHDVVSKKAALFELEIDVLEERPN